jgi:hypothetical protein
MITKLTDSATRTNELKITYTVQFPVTGDEYAARQAFTRKSYDLKTFIGNGYFVGVLIKLGGAYDNPLQFVSSSTASISQASYSFKKSRSPTSSPVAVNSFERSPAFLGLILSFSLGVPLVAVLVVLIYYRSKIFKQISRCFRGHDPREVEFGTIVSASPTTNRSVYSKSSSPLNLYYPSVGMEYSKIPLHFRDETKPMNLESDIPQPTLATGGVDNDEEEDDDDDDDEEEEEEQGDDYEEEDDGEEEENDDEDEEEEENNNERDNEGERADTGTTDINDETKNADDKKVISNDDNQVGEVVNEGVEKVGMDEENVENTAVADDDVRDATNEDDEISPL